MRRRHFLHALASLPLTACAGDETAPLIAKPSLARAPFAQLVGEGRARLRFETLVDEAISVVLSTDGGSQTMAPTRTTQDVTYERTFLKSNPDFLPDEPGAYTLHELMIDDLEPGVSYQWRIEAETAVEGSFMAPPTVGTAHKVGWIADTSHPFSAEPVGLIEGVDLFMHGGDLQYQSSPLDTWTGMAESFRPLTSKALFHVCVGNHEFEDLDEIDQMYDRLFGGQGGTDERFYAITFGGVRWICLDSETMSLADNAAQLTWFENELAAAASSGDIAQTIVAFHRPVYSLSKHYSSSTASRDAIHGLMVQHGVGLVLQGHAHCYERFVVDGIHYVVDGGGGAILYDPNEDLEKADQERPGESDLRVAVSETFGATNIAVDEAGNLSVERHDSTGAMTDSFSVSPPV